MIIFANVEGRFYTHIVPPCIPKKKIGSSVRGGVNYSLVFSKKVVLYLCIPYRNMRNSIQGRPMV